MKRLKKLADVYYSNDDKSISKEKLQSCAEECCNRLGINTSTIQIDNSSNVNVIFGDENEFMVSIDFYNDSNDGPTINRIITSVSKNFPGKIHYVETREQQDLKNFLYETSHFIDWIDDALEKIEDSEIH